MEWTITINQRAYQAIAPTLDFTDAAIVSVIRGLSASTAPKIVNNRKHDDKGDLTWVDYKTLIASVPMSFIKSRQGMFKRLQKIEAAGIIETRTENLDFAKKRMYIRLTPLADKLFRGSVKPHVNESLQSHVNESLHNSSTNNTNTNVLVYGKRLDNKTDTSSISKQSKINSAAKEVYDWAREKHGRKFTNPGKQFKALHTALNAGFSPDQIKRKWNEMLGDDFWEEKGFDFANVASQLSKKHAGK